MSSAGARWMGRVAQLGCLICRRLGRGCVPPQCHHIVDGDDFSVAPLCPEHHDPHRTGSGFHGMGEKRFCEVFKVPGLRELGLLVWVCEDMAKYGPRML